MASSKGHSKQLQCVSDVACVAFIREQHNNLHAERHIFYTDDDSLPKQRSLTGIKSRVKCDRDVALFAASKIFLKCHHITYICLII